MWVYGVHVCMRHEEDDKYSREYHSFFSKINTGMLFLLDESENHSYLWNMCIRYCSISIVSGGRKYFSLQRRVCLHRKDPHRTSIASGKCGVVHARTDRPKSLMYSTLTCIRAFVDIDRCLKVWRSWNKFRMTLYSRLTLYKLVHYIYCDSMHP